MLDEDKELTLTPEEEALWEMDDESLEEAFKKAKAEQLNNEIEDIESNGLDSESEDIDDTDEDEFDDEKNNSEKPEEDDDSTDMESDTDIDDNTTDDKNEMESKEDKDQPEENKESDVENKPQTYKIKANGVEIDFTIDELLKLAPKGMDYTKKLQEVAPWRKTISALKEADLGIDDVNLMIDVFKGNKEAIAAIMKRAGIDNPLDIDVESENEYKPNNYAKSDLELDLAEVESRISNDKEYAITAHIVNDQWDDNSKSILASNPIMIEGLHNDIKSGLYDKIAPIMIKKKALDGGRQSDLDYYMLAAKEVISKEKINDVDEILNNYIQKQNKNKTEMTKVVDNVKERQARQKSIKDKAKVRKAGAPTRTRSNRTVIDYLDDNDEEFDKWYKQLQERM